MFLRYLGRFAVLGSGKNTIVRQLEDYLKASPAIDVRVTANAA
jgi:hypothetical protein